MNDDIRGGAPQNWLVVGWFTPDYRPLAEAFAANLTEHGIPFHLFAKLKPNAIDRLNLILLKPAVVLEAMETYPDKTVVLMDVDCTVEGDISPLVQFKEDVGLAVFAGTVPSRRKDWRILLGVSTRVVAFRPTESARAFAREWSHRVKTVGEHEERCMALAFLAARGVSFAHIDPRYSGRDIGMVKDAVIVHDSAHEKRHRAERGRIKMALRAFEKRFLRSGRTRQNRLKGDMAEVMKASAT